MSTRGPDPAELYGPQRNAGRGLRLGTIRGIEIRLDPSLTIIFTLLVVLLALSVFPDWHPDWGTATTWLTAVATGVLFFASLLAHELAHSMVALRYGIPVPRITLFLFGGAAEISREPETPRSELLMALAGPATSLVLGVLFAYLATYTAGPGFAEALSEDPKAALATLSPLSTLLLWLGPVNVLLGLFNLLPGFPMDGGRVFRALIWWVTGDLRRATRVASGTGRLVGWGLMALGVLQGLSGYLVQGLWLLLIGWFLSASATAGYRQLVVRDTLKGIAARDLMRTRFETVAANLPVADFIEDQLLQSAQELWPVVEEGDRLIGLVTLPEIANVPAADRAAVRIGQVMRDDLPALSLAPDTPAARVLQALEAHATPLAVVDRGRVIGLLSQKDAAKWLTLHR